MANMSDAFGEITIYAASVDVLIDLIQCHLKYEEGAYYSTSLDLFEDVSPENRTEIIKIVEENYELDSTTHDAMLVSDFTATGRWSFKSNIGWFFGCLTEDYSKYPQMNRNHAQKQQISRLSLILLTVSLAVISFSMVKYLSIGMQKTKNRKKIPTQLKRYLILFKICWIITSMILERLYLLNGC